MTDTRYAEHPLDVLSIFLRWQEEAPCALIVLVRTVGGAVRAPGALMAVREDGLFAGYMSGGCIDADLVLRATDALKSRKSQTFVYGVGSPFIDLPLPCGGSIEVRILPEPDIAVLKRVVSTLSARQTIQLIIGEDGTLWTDTDERSTSVPVSTFVYEPKIRLRIAGRGADCLALARIAETANLDVHLQLNLDADVQAATQAGLAHVEHLKSVTQATATSDDPWTAFALTFHDRDWEAPLLSAALEGPAFYIGAVGSRRTHDIRTTALRRDGSSEADISRIHAPIGLVGSLRDASSLALSALAEITGVFASRTDTFSQSTALLLLAAGGSTRFEAGDKLTAKLDGETVLARTAALRNGRRFACALAVVRPEDQERQAILKSSGWETTPNADWSRGLSSSLVTGLAALKGREGVKKVIILLADMPFVSTHHLDQLLLMGWNRTQAVISHDGDHLTPPVLIDQSQIDQLIRSSGDKGAKSIIAAMANRTILHMDRRQGVDIDTVSDLKAQERIKNV